MEIEWKNPSQSRRDLVKAMHCELHDLCQPLTALLCMLEIGRMTDDPVGLREVLDGGMEETRRIFAIVSRMRISLRAEEMSIAAGTLRYNTLETASQKEN